MSAGAGKGPGRCYAHTRAHTHTPLLTDSKPCTTDPPGPEYSEMCAQPTLWGHLPHVGLWVPNHGATLSLVNPSQPSCGHWMSPFPESRHGVPRRKEAHQAALGRLLEAEAPAAQPPPLPPYPPLQPKGKDSPLLLRTSPCKSHMHLNPHLGLCF